MRGQSERSDFLSRFENFFNDFERDYFSKERSSVEKTLDTPLEYSPEVDIEESENVFMISVDLPGLKKDEIRVDVNKSKLRIYGERRRETKEEENTYFERVHGRFVRNFTLPQSIDTEKIEAHFEDGVLKVVLPKKEIAAPYKVKVETGSLKGLLNRFLHRGSNRSP
ncbi:Hsp20/alpha crystallin family protein [Bdellovibrio sp. HCB337]|uniref:Hsp20/alpha crystallin family protein n=1 Tax=Bdellovibrio sp. HCB337 TaxID=3394358 RepID=UPI0039A51ECB